MADTPATSIPETVATASTAMEIEAPQAASTEGEATPHLSKKALKRIQKEKDRKEYWQKKRKQEKEAKKVKRRKLIDEARARGEDVSSVVPMRKKKKVPTIFSDQKVVLDFQFFDLMQDKEKRSMVNQLVHLYGANMKLDVPLQLFCTDMGAFAQAAIAAIEGHNNWKGVTTEAKSYLDLFPKDKLVYLTSESDVVLDKLDPSDTYIIGAIVDHNRLKGITYKRATEQGIRTARLPIEDFMEMKTRKVLTVNQVAEMLMGYWRDNGSWAQVLAELIPKRKGAKRKAEAQLDQDNTGVDSTSEEADEELVAKEESKPAEEGKAAAVPPE